MKKLVSFIGLLLILTTIPLQTIGESNDQLDNTSIESWPRMSGQEGVAYDSATFSLGHDHLCLITNNGSVMCAGYNINGQIGHGGGGSNGGGCVDSWSCPNLMPIDLPDGYIATSVTAGYRHSCAIMLNGSVFCWGYVSPSDGNQYSPIMVQLPNPATAVVAGKWHTCAITEPESGDPHDSEVLCWAGAGRLAPYLNLWSIDLGHGALAISASSDMDQYCAITSIGSVACWTLTIGEYDASTPSTDIDPADFYNHEGGVAFGLGSGEWPYYYARYGSDSYQLMDFRAFSISQGGGTTCALGNTLQDFGPHIALVCWGEIPRNGGFLAHSRLMAKPAVIDFVRGTPNGNESFMVLVGGEAEDIQRITVLSNLSSVFDYVDNRNSMGGTKGEGGECFLPNRNTLEWPFPYAGGNYLACWGSSFYTDGCCYKIQYLNSDFVVGDRDSDDDSVWNVLDAFPHDDSEWDDTDFDGIGDNQDSDDDGDGFEDELDIFPLDPQEWSDSDGDGVGDNADLDDDGDGFSDSDDAFPLDPLEWMDTDGDGTGDNADTDDDGDGFSDSDDAFPLDPLEWMDTDGDGTGDNADTDDDNDGFEDTYDAFPLERYASTDTDSDGLPDSLWGPSLLVEDIDDDNDRIIDAIDSCPLGFINWASTIASDYDGDGCRDSDEDTDDDNDGISDIWDAFPYNNEEWTDTDGDGTGDNADTDDDNDGVSDIMDAFPYNRNESADSDGDGVGDNTDEDDDNDGVHDFDDSGANLDNCRTTPNTDQMNYDGDNNGDSCDEDDDNDGIHDLTDHCPMGSLNWTSSQNSDYDGDGCKDSDEDTDDDNDGFSDWHDSCPLDADQSDGFCFSSMKREELALFASGGVLIIVLSGLLMSFLRRKGASKSNYGTDGEE